MTLMMKMVMIMILMTICDQTMSTYVATLSNGFGRGGSLNLQTEWTILILEPPFFLGSFSR